MGNVILEVKDLKVSFYKHRREGQAVRDVNFTLEEGQTLGIIGESGSGKSVSGMSVMGLVPSIGGKIRSGEIIYEGSDLLKLSPKEMRKIQGNKIAMIFQEPMTSLNPVFTVGYQLCEPLRFHLHMTKEEAEKRAVELLRMVGLSSPEKRVLQYPHQLSGGMRQRVMIAMALACQPNILIADEPTTALDVTVQAQILQLLRQLKQAQPHSAVILVTHDMGVIAENADRVAVMYAGQIVEEADVIPLFHRPLHPYTEGLMASMPSLTEEKEHLETIEGTVPSIYNMPIGCAFCNRCKYAKDCCRKVEPKMMTLPADESGVIRRVRCLKYDENYRKEWENG